MYKFAIHNVSHSAILNVCRKQLDMPVHKVKYALTTGLLNGAFKSLENYGIELNRESFGIFEVYSHYIHVKYVHQLQNLYFPLTCEELPVC